MRLAKDHFAYIGIYRNAIDTLQQLNAELWNTVMNDKSEQSDKTDALKEIHKIEKTKVLLLKSYVNTKIIFNVKRVCLFRFANF